MSGCHDPILKRNIMDDVNDSLLAIQQDYNNKLEKLEAHISKLHDMINMEDRISASDVLCRLSQLETHKNYQIDENRKVSKRIDKLESDHLDQLNPHAFLILKKIIDELENDYASKIDNRKDLNNALSAIQEDYKTRLAVFEDHMKRYHELMLGTSPIELEKTIRANMRVKAPHKCPVCDGAGCLSFRNPPLTLNDIKPDCHGCEGKGIVWG